MASRYEIWLLDDGGRRICLLDQYDYFSYSRSVTGFGTFEIGIPYDIFVTKIFPIFQVDRRIDIWRSPSEDIPMRREHIYLLRMYRIYTRETDRVQIIQLYGRDAKDLLNRRIVAQAAGTSYTRKTDHIDDMMKQIVREQMLSGSALDPDGALSANRALPRGEFKVQEDLSLGTSVTYNFSERNVLETLKELHRISSRLHTSDPLNNEKIYFDVVPYEISDSVDEILEEATDAPILDESGDPLLSELQIFSERDQGFRFEIYGGLRGIDRTSSSLVFSVENENLKDPYYSKSSLEEVNSVIVKGFGRGDSRDWEIVDSDAVNESRWNRVEAFYDASVEPEQTNLENYGNEMLWEKRAEEKMSAVFQNHPGSDNAPRSLYGIDWDLGDLLPVEYAGNRMNAEVDIVYVSFTQDGENVSGRSNIETADQE